MLQAQGDTKTPEGDPVEIRVRWHDAAGETQEVRAESLIVEMPKNVSGRAINLLQQGGIAELGPFVLAYRGWKIRLYRAIWNAGESRVEMHLVSLRRQRIRVAAARTDIVMEEGETIWTESSYKYRPGEVAWVHFVFLFCELNGASDQTWSRKMYS